MLFLKTKDTLVNALGGELLRSSLWVFLARLAGLIIGLIVTIIVARTYGPEATGLLALINSSALVFGTLCACGQGTLLIRELSAGGPDHRTKQKWIIYRRSLKLSIALYAALIFPSASIVAQQVPNQTTSSLFILYTIICVLFFARTLEFLTVNASRAIVPAPIYSIFILLPVLIYLTALLAAVILSYNSIFAPIVSLTSGITLASLVALVYISRALNTSTLESKKNPIGSIKRQFGAGLPFLVSAIFNTLLIEGNIIIAGSTLEISELGIYSVACKIAILSAFAFTSIGLVAQTGFARLRDIGGVIAMQQYAKQVSLLTTCATVPIVVFLCLSRHWLVDFAFGEEFAQAAEVTVILLIGYGIAALSGPTDPYLSMTGGQNMLAVIIGVSAAIGSVLTAILTPLYGMSGAAVALTTSLAIWNLSALVAIRLRDGFWLFWIPALSKVNFRKGTPQHSENSEVDE